MTRDRKLLIITGATLIALIIAIAAFSLGVYVGIHGWTAGPPSVAGPGQKQPRPPDQGAQPPQGGPGQPSPRPQLVGHVRSVSGETITLDTPEGPRLFQVGADVQVFRAGKDGEEPATLEEIGPGERLAVFGRFEGNGRQQLIAERLVLLPQPEGLNQRAPGEPQPPSPGGQDQPGPRPQLVGQVRSISGETITLDTPQGPRLFQLGENVEVFRRDQGSEEPALLEEIIPGDHLAVFGRFEGNGGKQLIAERLVLLPPPPDKQP